MIIASGHNNIFYNNLVYNNTTVGNGAAVSVAYTDSIGSNQLYNNTIYGNSGPGIQIDSSSVDTMYRLAGLFSDTCSTNHRLFWWELA